MTNQASPSKFVEAALSLLAGMLAIFLTNCVMALSVWVILKYLIQWSVAWSTVLGFCLLLEIGAQAVKSAWHN